MILSDFYDNYIVNPKTNKNLDKEFRCTQTRCTFEVPGFSPLRLVTRKWYDCVVGNICSQLPKSLVPESYKVIILNVTKIC